MQLIEKVLWGIGLAIQILLVIGAISLSWVFESSNSGKSNSEQVALVEKGECTEICQQNFALLTQVNREQREALRYSNKAIQDFAFAMLFLAIVQLVICVRFVIKESKNKNQVQ